MDSDLLFHQNLYFHFIQPPIPQITLAGRRFPFVQESLPELAASITTLQHFIGQSVYALGPIDSMCFIFMSWFIPYIV